MILVLLIYDWVLCLNREVEFIWNWHSKLTATSLVYAFSRYAMLIQTILTLATINPISDKVRNLATISILLTFSPFTMYVEVSSSCQLTRH